MPENPTTSELVKTKAITSLDVELLLDTYLAAYTPTFLRLGLNHQIDVEAAIDAHLPTAKALADPATTSGFRRKMILTAILLAQPEKG